jgi:hypothetical protein
MYFTDDRGRVLALTVVDIEPGPDGPLTAMAGGPTVRGHDTGILTGVGATYPLIDGHVPSPAAASGVPMTLLEWSETDTTSVTLAGSGLDPDELVQIAESLRQVDARTWSSYLGLHEPGDEPAVPDPKTPSEPVPTTEAVPPPVTGETATTGVTLPPAPAGAERLAGTSHGTQEWHETDGHCPDLDHTQDETVTMADGAAWTYHAEYCGDVEGVLWHGDGRFSLTDPGGDGLNGAISVGWLTMGTAGSPRLITITGGTGAWTGASGTCLVDETVQVSSFGYHGTAVHDGTFTCDVALSP